MDPRYKFHLHFAGGSTVQMLYYVGSSVGSILCICRFICLSIVLEDIILIQTHQGVCGGKGT